MAQVLDYTSRVREALKAPGRVGTEAIVFVAAIATFFGLFQLGRQWTAPYHPQVQIDLSFKSLPAYTLLSLGRGFAAYALSLLFTLVYGTIAAHNFGLMEILKDHGGTAGSATRLPSTAWKETQDGNGLKDIQHRNHDLFLLDQRR
jgi:hypothetical protein